MKIKIAVVLTIVGAIIYVYSQNKNSDFAQAGDFPRGAVSYAQFADLPQFIELWENSDLKKNYLQSENFRQFQNRNLALKLTERWKEFNDAAGFPLDFPVFGKMAKMRAAFAVYDIGKLDTVFIAPVNEEIFATIGFVEKKDRFEENALEDGTKFYSQSFKVDGGRQSQKLVFSNYKGRFVLATDEKLFLRTIAVIGGKNAKDSLVDEPDFENLSRKQSPHAATFWVNQAKLNEDYYFKRYWLMSNRENLKKYRAAIFDFEPSEEKWTEHRTILLAEKQSVKAKIKESEFQKLIEIIPEYAAFYNVQTIENNEDAIYKTLFENSVKPQFAEKKPSWNSNDFAYTDFGLSSEIGWHDYDYLGEKFDEKIDVEEENFLVEPEMFTSNEDFSNSLREILAQAQPKIVLSAVNPQIMPAPLLMEFRRIAVLTLENPNKLNNEKLENLLAKNLEDELIIAGKSAKINWETKTENGKTWRELNPPTLGWGIAYVLDDDDLIFSNSPGLLRKIILRERKNDNENIEKIGDSFDEMTVINLSQRKEAFDVLMNKLAFEELDVNKLEPEKDFFTENIGNLLDAGKDVEKIEIRRDFSADILREQLDFVFKR